MYGTKATISVRMSIICTHAEYVKKNEVELIQLKTSHICTSIYLSIYLNKYVTSSKKRKNTSNAVQFFLFMGFAVVV